MTELLEALALAQRYREECHDLRGRLQAKGWQVTALTIRLEAALRERDEALAQLRDRSPFE